jgi:hypothetical protein
MNIYMYTYDTLLMSLNFSNSTRTKVGTKQFHTRIPLPERELRSYYYMLDNTLLMEHSVHYQSAEGRNTVTT